jgi:hypothetical protein
MEGMAKGEVDASMVWATAIAVARQEFPDASSIWSRVCAGTGASLQQPFRGTQGRQEPPRVRQQSIDKLLSDGKVKQIVELRRALSTRPFSS